MGNSDFMGFDDDFPWDLMMVKTVNNYEICLPETHGKMMVSHGILRDGYSPVDKYIANWKISILTLVNVHRTTENQNV